MEVVYSEALIAYMKKKGYSFISVESISPKGCCADSTELLVTIVPNCLLLLFLRRRQNNTRLKAVEQ